MTRRSTTRRRGQEQQSISNNTDMPATLWRALNEAIITNPELADSIRRSLNGPDSRSTTSATTTGNESENDNPTAEDRSGGTKSLNVLLQELDLAALWNEREYKLSTCSFIYRIMLLLESRYTNSIEQEIVNTLHTHMKEAATAKNVPQSTPDFNNSAEYWQKYASRGRYLARTANFRWLLEFAERLNAITRKEKVDLILLYFMLTSEDSVLFRDTLVHNSPAVEQLTGFEMRSAPLLTKPLVISLQLDRMFGNVARNSTLLERSVCTALRNHKRRYTEEAVLNEIDSVMATTRSLSTPKQTVDEHSLKLPYIGSGQEASLLHNMLDHTTIVSMMAEEFRVFISDVSRLNDSIRKSKMSPREPALSHSLNFRRPVFYAFNKVAPKNRAAVEADPPTEGSVQFVQV